MAEELFIPIMAGLSSSTTKRSARNLSHEGISSDDLAAIRRAWDDEDDEVVEFTNNSKVDQKLSSLLSGNASGSTAVSDALSHRVPTYSLTTVRAAKTICLFVCFLGLVSISH